MAVFAHGSANAAPCLCPPSPISHSVSSQGDKDPVRIASTGAYQGQSVAKACTKKQMSFQSACAGLTRGVHLHDGHRCYLCGQKRL